MSKPNNNKLLAIIITSIISVIFLVLIVSRMIFHKNQSKHRNPETVSKLKNPANDSDESPDKNITDYSMHVDYKILEEKYSYPGSSSEIKLGIDTNKIKTKIVITLPDTVEIPSFKEEVYGHKLTRKRDWLRIYVQLTDKNRGQIASLFKEQVQGAVKNLTAEFEFTPGDFAKIKANTDLDLTMSVKIFASNYNNKKHELKVCETKLKFDFKVYPVYSSRLYFNSIKLNKKLVDLHLGSDNDFKDPAPEILLNFVCEGDYFESIEGKNNSYIYSQPEAKTFYHNSGNANILIKVYDKDAFVNRNDWISDTLVSIRSLVGINYKTIRFNRIDELKIYCTTRGKIN